MWNKRGKGQQPKPASKVEDYDLYVDGVDNSYEFELPEEEDNLKRTWEHQKVGGEFVVRKSFNSKGIKNRRIAGLLHFPSEEEVMDLVENKFGGGEYTIHPGNSPRVLKTYHLPGLSKFLIDGPKPKTPKQILKESMDEWAVEELRRRMEEDFEFRQELLIDYLNKNYGISPPTQAEKYEERFQEHLIKHPELERQLFQAEIRKKLKEMGVEEPSVFEPLEKMIEIQGLVKDLTGQNNNDSWPSLLKAATEAFLEVVKDPNWLQSFPGLNRTNSGIQHSIEGPSQGSPGPAGGGFKAAEIPNPAVVDNVEDSNSVHRREDVYYFDEERLI